MAVSSLQSAGWQVHAAGWPFRCHLGESHPAPGQLLGAGSPFLSHLVRCHGAPRQVLAAVKASLALPLDDLLAAISGLGCVRSSQGAMSAFVTGRSPSLD